MSKVTLVAVAHLVERRTQEDKRFQRSASMTVVKTCVTSHVYFVTASVLLKVEQRWRPHIRCHVAGSLVRACID